MGAEEYTPPRDAAGLRAMLARPPRQLPFGFVLSPEQDIIDGVRSGSAPGRAAETLVEPASALLRECEDEIAAGNDIAGSAALAARLGFLCATLGLAIDGAPFSRMARTLLAPGRVAGTLPAQDLFQVLRTAGRYEVRRLPPEGERVPWDDLLGSADRGIRTLAAQVIVRLAPSSAIGRLPSLFGADVNGGLLAHEVLTALGEPAAVAEAVAAGPVTARMLAPGLRDSGHDGAAQAIEERMAESPETSLPRPPERMDTPRLVLRRASADDAGALFAAYASDPEVARYMTWQVHPDPGMTREFLLAYDDLWEMGAKFLYVLHARDDPAPLGVVDMRPKDGGMEFGYALARASWGQGLMPEAVTALVGWCMAQPEIGRVSGYCDVDNVASARTMVKAGMQFSRVLPRHAVHPNVGPEARDCLLHELRRPR